MNEFMKKAIENADNGITNNEGGPFGAVIVSSKTEKLFQMEIIKFYLKKILQLMLKLLQ